ncbi:putative reverse transcriptase domain-containing protein [Tanacetum coccineum]
MLRDIDQLIERKEDGGMYFIWVPLIGDVRTLIMDEAHASRFIATARVDRVTKSAHFLAIREDYKMVKLARLYIDEIVAGHGVPVSIILDRDGRFTSSYHLSIRCAPFEALHGRKCRSPVLWAEIGESRLVRLELVQETTYKVVLIKEKLKDARDRQKSYVDNRRKLLEFEVEDQVLLKVSPWKGVVRLERKTC